MDLQHAEFAMPSYCMNVNATTATKGANHNCPARKDEDDGLGLDNINWDNIKYRVCI